MALCGLALCGLLDYWTGYEYAVSLFYLVPLAYAGWFLGRPWGYLLSLLAAVTMQLANIWAGEVHTTPTVYYWNTVTRLGVFAVTVTLMQSLRRRLELERELSRIDPSTGALNPRGFRERLEAARADASRFDRPLTLLYLDADDFKGINDRHGHGEGDRVLRAVAEVLRQSLRGGDAAGRMGGDEFAVLLPATDAEGGRAVAEKLLASLTRTMEERGWALTFSVGCATFRAAPESLDSALNAADTLMFQAKRSGPGRIRAAEVTGAP